MISERPVTDDVHFDHLIRWYLPGFSTGKLYFPVLISIPWGSTLKLYKYLIPHQTFNVFNYLYLHGLVIFYFLNTVCYYNNSLVLKLSPI